MAPTWTWTTNNTALYTNWAPDEPVDPSSFECGSVREDTYLWKKELCYAARPFVCTVNPNNAPATAPPSESSRDTHPPFFQAILHAIQDTPSMKSSVSKSVAPYLPLYQCYSSYSTASPTESISTTVACFVG